MSEGKLKVAVCFFGHLRSYQSCAPFLHRNFLKYHDCDLFMHTWSELDHSTQTWYKPKKMDGMARREDIISAYGNLKSIEIEEQKPEELGVIIVKPNQKISEAKMSIFGIGAVLHSMRASLRQYEEYAARNKVKYDYVLFARPDFYLRKPLNIQETLDAFPKQKTASGFFTFANPIANATAGFENMSGLDICFFATPETMSDIIGNNALAIKDLKPDMEIDYSPEYNLIKLVKARGATPYRIENFSLPKDWGLLRTTAVIKLDRRIIRLRIRKNLFILWLFPAITQRIVNIQIDLFGIFKFDLAIGDPDRDVDYI